MNPDSRLYAVLTMLADLVVINIAVVICSLPIITSGPAIACALVLSMTMISGNTIRPLGDFLATFGRAARATVPWTVLLLVINALIAWEWWASGQFASRTLFVVVRALLLLVWLLVTITAIWMWLILAARIHHGQTSSVRESRSLARLGLLSGIRHLPLSGLVVLMIACPIFLGMLTPGIGARLTLFYLIIGYALTSYLTVLVTRGPLGIDLPAQD